MNMRHIGIAILDTISISVRKNQTIIDGIDRLGVPGYIAKRIAQMSAATRESLGEEASKWIVLDNGFFSIDYDKLGSSLAEIEVYEMQSEEIQTWIIEGAPLKMIRDVMGVPHRRVSNEMAAVKIAMPDGPYANGRAAIIPAVVNDLAQNGKIHLKTMRSFADMAREFNVTLPEMWASYKSLCVDREA